MIKPRWFLYQFFMLRYLKFFCLFVSLQIYIMADYNSPDVSYLSKLNLLVCLKPCTLTSDSPFPPAPRSLLSLLPQCRDHGWDHGVAFSCARPVPPSPVSSRFSHMITWTELPPPKGWTALLCAHTFTFSLLIRPLTDIYCPCLDYREKCHKDLLGYRTDNILGCTNIFQFLSIFIVADASGIVTEKPRQIQFHPVF